MTRIWGLSALWAPREPPWHLHFFRGLTETWQHNPGLVHTPRPCLAESPGVGVLPLTACPRGDSQAASHGTCSAMRAPQILEDPCPPPHTSWDGRSALTHIRARAHAHMRTRTHCDCPSEHQRACTRAGERGDKRLGQLGHVAGASGVLATCPCPGHREDERPG